MTPLKAIRAKCLECCGGSWRDVKFCTAGNCPLHEYRTGRRPKSIQGPQSPAFDGQKTANCPEGYTGIYPRTNGAEIERRGPHERGSKGV